MSNEELDRKIAILLGWEFLGTRFSSSLEIVQSEIMKLTESERLIWVKEISKLSEDPFEIINAETRPRAEALLVVLEQRPEKKPLDPLEK
jgi:hypothetical protein